MHIKLGRWFNLNSIVGLLCILAGGLFSAPTLLHVVRAADRIPTELQGKLLAGALIFRVCLVLLGLVVLLLGRLPIWQTKPVNTKSASTPTKRGGEGWLMLALLVVALALRLYDLSDGLWHDEITTYVTYVQPMTLGEIASTYISENQHFLYNLSARLAVQIFGDGSWSLRLPAVLFGVASIWALYWLGREVTSRQEALLAAALMTFSYHHIWFSQNARGYTALLFWALLSSWFLIRALDGAGARYWLGYALAAALGIFTHTTMIFMIAGHFVSYLWLLIQRRQRVWPDCWHGFWLGFCLAGFFTICLHALALPQMLSTIGEASTVPAWKNPLWTLLEILRGLRIGFLGAAFVIPALLVFGVGVASYARSKPIVLQFLFLPILFCTALVFGLGHHLWPRFFFFAMGFGVLVAIRGVQVLGQFVASSLKVAKLQPVWVGATMAVGMILVSALSVPFAYGPKQDYQQALAFVNAGRQPGDAVVVMGLATYTYEKFYKTDWAPIETLNQLSTTRAHAKRTWLVYTFPPEMDAVYPGILGVVQREFTPLKQFPGTLNNGTVYVVRSDAPTAQR